MQICNKNAPINNIGYRLGHNLHEWCLLCTSVLCILSPYTSLQIQHFKLITVFCMILRLHNLLASEVNNTITLYINLCWAGSHLISVLSWLTTKSSYSHLSTRWQLFHIPRDFTELGKSAYPYFSPWSCNNLQNTQQLTDFISLREFEMCKSIYLKQKNLNFKNEFKIFLI